MSQNRFSVFEISDDGIFYKTNKQKAIQEVINKLPAVNIHYKNARPVQILENQIKKMRVKPLIVEDLMRVKPSIEQDLMIPFKRIIENLKELDKTVNKISCDPVQEKEALKQNIENLLESIQAFKKNLLPNSGAFKIFEKVESNITILSAKFEATIANVPLSRDAMNYLHAAQKRDKNESYLYEDKISTLGTYLNYVCCELVGGLAKTLPLPEYEDTIAQNFISLSENSLILQDTLEQIQYQRKLSYKRYVDTHTRNQLNIDVPDVQGEYFLKIDDALENLNPEETYEYLTQFIANHTEKNKPGTAGWFTAGRLVWNLFGGRETYLEDYDKSIQEKKKIKKFYLNLQGIVIGFLSALASTFVFAVNLVIATILFSADFVLGLIAFFVSPFLGIEKSFSIAHNLSKFQKLSRDAQIDALTGDEGERETLKKIIAHHKKNFNFFELFANAIQSAFQSEGTSSTPWYKIIFSKLKNLSEKLVLMFSFKDKNDSSSSVIDNVRKKTLNTLEINQSIQTGNPNSSTEKIYLSLPKGGDSIITARSPTEMPIDVMLLVSDEIIGPWRARYNWPSSIAAAACMTSMGFTLFIPAAITSKLGLTSLGNYCQYLTANIAKSFLGFEHLSDPVHEFVAMTVEWKISNLTVEVIGDISSGRGEKFNYFINNYQWIVPALTISTLIGIEIGNLPIINPASMPPVINHIVDFWVNITNMVINEAKQIQHGQLGLTSIGYSCLLIKLGLFVHSLVDTKDLKEDDSTFLRELAEILIPELSKTNSSNLDEVVKTIQKALLKKYSSNEEIRQKIQNLTPDILKKMIEETKILLNQNTSVSSHQQDFIQKKQDVEHLLIQLSNPIFLKEISQLSLQEKAQFYCEMIDKIHQYNALAYSYGLYNHMINFDTLENLKIRFSNRFILSEYSALWRLPVLFFYPGMVILRAFFRKIFYRNQTELQKAELAQLKAHDAILFNEWEGMIRSVAFQASGLLIQTIVFMIVIACLPFALIYSVLFQTNLGSNLKAIENNIYAIPAYLSWGFAKLQKIVGIKREEEALEFNIGANKEFGQLGRSIHQGTICTEIEDLASQVRLPSLTLADQNTINGINDVSQKKQEYLQKIKSSDLTEFAKELSKAENALNSRSQTSNSPSQTSKPSCVFTELKEDVIDLSKTPSVSDGNVQNVENRSNDPGPGKRP